MEKYLTYTVKTGEEHVPVQRLLRQHLGLSAHQISAAKFRRGGITCEGRQIRVTAFLKPGDELRVLLEESAAEEARNAQNEQNAQKQCGAIEDKQKAGPAAVVKSAHITADTGSLEILYEDEDLLAVNKPAGLPVHPGRGHYCDTLANRVQAYLSQKEGPQKIRAVGRLDKDTSGVVIFAKNAVAAARVQAQSFEEHHKHYYAIAELCEGQRGGDISDAGLLTKSISEALRNAGDHAAADSAAVCADDAQKQRPALYNQQLQTEKGKNWLQINLPMRKAPGSLNKMEVCLPGEGKEALTFVRVAAGSCVCFEAVPVTGRTHQIRVHLAAIGYPLAGDPIYGSGAQKNEIQGNMADENADNIISRGDGYSCMNRTALHCVKAVLRQPFTGEELVICAPLPKDMTAYLNMNYMPKGSVGDIIKKAISERTGGVSV